MGFPTLYPQNWLEEIIGFTLIFGDKNQHVSCMFPLNQPMLDLLFYMCPILNNQPFKIALYLGQIFDFQTNPIIPSVD